MKKAKTDSIGFKMFEWLSNFSKNERYDFNYGLLRVSTGIYGRIGAFYGLQKSSGLEEMSSGLSSLEDSSV